MWVISIGFKKVVFIFLIFRYLCLVFYFRIGFIFFLSKVKVKYLVFDVLGKIVFFIGFVDLCLS